MNALLRTAALGVLAAAALVGAQSANAQSLVVGNHLMTTLSPSPLPYRGPGTVPNQCLPVPFGGHIVQYCQKGTFGTSVAPMPGDRPFDLLFAGYKIVGFKVPDYCLQVDMRGQPAMMRATFCQHTGWGW